MYYSQKLLHRYLSLDVDIETISNELTLKSCEVEEIHQRSIPALVVIGKVLSVEKHPDADKLVVCQLDCGSHGTYQICTGATNMVVGHYVPVALPGAHLPVINLTIEPRKMRGEDSNGMICSKEELGIADDAGFHAIWTLQGNGLRTDAGKSEDLTAGDFDDITDKDLGMPLSDKYAWLESWVIDVENKTITHRPDMFGHFGLALELRTLFPSNIRFSKLKDLGERMNPGHILQLLENSEEGTTKTNITSPHVSVYTTINISNVNVSASSFYAKLQLLDCGLPSKNNWVDFSTLFMLTTGQPIHFFDKNKVEGTITVRQATEGELFMDLFDVEHVLTEQDILIVDDKKPIALAGIVGGKTSGIDENTTDIIAEIANFDPVVVRKTGTRLGLRTDAEVRFEKYINPLFSLAAVELFMDEIAYNKPGLGSYTIDGVTPWFTGEDTTVLQRIEVNREHIYSMIYGSTHMGSSFVKESTETLQNLGCRVSGNTVISPLWRSPEDLTLEADIVEEIARIIGFNTIEERLIPNNSGFVEFIPAIRLLRETEDYLLQTHGLNQVETYPWLNKQRKKQAEEAGASLISLKNPLNPDESNLRHTMQRSMLEVLQKNAPFFEVFNVFDYGKVWNKNWEITEHDALCVGFYSKKAESLTHPLRTAKEIVDGVLHLRNLRGKLEYIPTEFSYGHPKQQGKILLNKKEIGSLLTIHPGQLEAVKIDSTAAVTILEMDITIIQEMLPEKQKKRKYPYGSLTDQIITRDMNFVIDSNEEFGIISTALLRCKEISNVEIFDLYAGENVTEGKKSCAVRITIQGDGTMTTEQINEVMNKALTSVEKAGGALRT